MYTDNMTAEYHDEQRQHSSKYNKPWNDTVMEDLHNIEMMCGDFVEKLQTTGHCAEDVLVNMLVRVDVVRSKVRSYVSML